MFDIVLFEPEIPPNTGNVIRLCANTGMRLHLVHPLGFELEDSRLRRAGLDYHEWAAVAEHESLDAFIRAADPTRLLPCSTRGRTLYSDVRYRPGDALLFGPETRGLPAEVLEAAATVVRIPMQTQSRSLNLSNAVAVVVYEAWRQHGFGGNV